MKIFSNHRRKLEPYRRFGGREFKDKLDTAKNYKRNFNPNSKNGLFSNFFAKTGMSQVGTFFGLLAFGAIFYFLVISPYFLINQVIVSGNSQVSGDDVVSQVSELSEKRFMLVPENSFFYLSEKRLNKVFAQNLPMVREVKAKRSWPNKISIEITERTPALILVVSDKNYLVDDLGFVIKEVPGNTPELKVIDQVSEDVRLGSIIDGKIIPFIISMEKLWPGKMTVPITLAKIPGKGATEVEFVSREGWSVFFSTDRPVANQLNNLLVLLNKQITNSNRSRLAYIDLRLAKWAYYCFKATPCQQTEQSGLEQTAGSNINSVENPGLPTPVPPPNPVPPQTQSTGN